MHQGLASGSFQHEGRNIQQSAAASSHLTSCAGPRSPAQTLRACYYSEYALTLKSAAARSRCRSARASSTLARASRKVSNICRRCSSATASKRRSPANWGATWPHVLSAAIGGSRAPRSISMNAILARLVGLLEAAAFGGSSCIGLKLQNSAGFSACFITHRIRDSASAAL